MSRFGIDYAVARFSGATLKSKDVTFVCRYLRNSPTGTLNKELTKSEADDIRSAGIDIVSNDETTGTRLTTGRSGGIADAQGAHAAHVACGGPLDRPIYFSPWDHDPAGLTTTQWNLLWGYLDGAASVLGLGRVGLYGGIDMISRAFDRQAITWGWQTYAWSENRWDSRAQIQQYSNGEWNGSVDFDRAMVADFGQWGGNMSANGPEFWDDADWKALDDNRFIRLAQWIAGKANTKYNTTSVGVSPPVSAAATNAAINSVLAAITAIPTAHFDDAQLQQLAAVIAAEIQALGITPPTADELLDALKARLEA